MPAEERLSIIKQLLGPDVEPEDKRLVDELMLAKTCLGEGLMGINVAFCLNHRRGLPCGKTGQCVGMY